MFLKKFCTNAKCRQDTSASSSSFFGVYSDIIIFKSQFHQLIHQTPGPRTPLLSPHPKSPIHLTSHRFSITSSSILSVPSPHPSRLPDLGDLNLIIEPLSSFSYVASIISSDLLTSSMLLIIPVNPLPHFGLRCHSTRIRLDSELLAIDHLIYHNLLIDSHSSYYTLLVFVYK